MRQNPSSNQFRRYKLRDAANDVRLLVYGCINCRRASYFLASDLVPIFGAQFYAPQACSRFPAARRLSLPRKWRLENTADLAAVAGILGRLPQTYRCMTPRIDLRLPRLADGERNSLRDASFSRTSWRRERQDRSGCFWGFPRTKIGGQTRGQTTARMFPVRHVLAQQETRAGRRRRAVHLGGLPNHNRWEVCIQPGLSDDPGAAHANLHAPIENVERLSNAFMKRSGFHQSVQQVGEES